MENKCMWIGTNNTVPGACTHNTVPGRSYCCNHLFQVYQEGTARYKTPMEVQIRQVWDVRSDFNDIVAELGSE